MFRRSFRRRTRSPLRNGVVPANNRPRQLWQPSGVRPSSKSTTSLRSPNPERTVARDGPRCRRFVAHWQHAAAPIYCALPRPLASSPRISLRQRYPPSASSPPCVLSRLLFLFFRLVYIDSCAIFPASTSSLLSSLLFRIPILPSPLFLFIFISSFLLFLLSLFSFVLSFFLAFYCLNFFLTHRYFNPFCSLRGIFSSRFLLPLFILLTFIAIFIFFYSYLIRLFLIRRLRRT